MFFEFDVRKFIKGVQVMESFRMWFVLEGAPPHIILVARQSYKHWIGREGPQRAHRKGNSKKQSAIVVLNSTCASSIATKFAFKANFFKYECLKIGFLNRILCIDEACFSSDSITLHNDDIWV